MYFSALFVTRLKVKEVDLDSAFIVVPHAQGAQVRIAQCYIHLVTGKHTQL